MRVIAWLLLFLFFPTVASAVASAHDWKKECPAETTISMKSQERQQLLDEGYRWAERWIKVQIANADQATGAAIEAGQPFTLTVNWGETVLRPLIVMVQSGYVVLAADPDLAIVDLQLKRAEAERLMNTHGGCMLVNSSVPGSALLLLSRELGEPTYYDYDPETGTVVERHP